MGFSIGVAKSNVELIIGIDPTGKLQRRIHLHPQRLGRLLPRVQLRKVRRRRTRRQAADSEKKISPQATEELFRSEVDEILKFASKDTTLPIHEPVKRRLVNRDEAVAFVQKHMSEDEDAQRLRRSELVLKKFGLLPRDFDLQSCLVVLLREQDCRATTTRRPRR